MELERAVLTQEGGESPWDGEQFVIQCLQQSCSLVGEKALASCAPLGAVLPVLLEWSWKTELGAGQAGAPQLHGWPGQAEFQWEQPRAEQGQVCAGI